MRTRTEVGKRQVIGELLTKNWRFPAQIRVFAIIYHCCVKGTIKMGYFFQNNALPHVLKIEKYAVTMRQIFVKYAVKMQ